MLNRGVEKRPIVIDDGDRMRFVQSLYVFNDENHAPNGVSQKRVRQQMSLARSPFVYLHAWCLMDNHYHLLVSPVNDDLKNVSQFMKKLNMGYAKFFNEKYERSGYLWQGRYKKVPITNHSQHIHIPHYIHLNPLDYIYPEWRKGRLVDSGSALEKLYEYRWSSFLDYMGNKNFPSLIYKNYLQSQLGDKKDHWKSLLNIIQDDSFTEVEKNFE